MPKLTMSRRSDRGTSARAFSKLASGLAEAGRSFYARGWVLGTSGNFSAVLARRPLRMAITTSGADKGLLTPTEFLEIDGDATVVQGTGKPSAEALLHLTLVRVRGAGAVLHTHSVWSTILSDAFAPQGGVTIMAYEMLKGLDGVATHEHREWLPILDNSQDMAALARTIEATLRRHPGAHGFLLRRHGLYTWGRDLAEARRHVEILEFLLEVLGTTRGATENEAPAPHLAEAGLLAGGRNTPQGGRYGHAKNSRPRSAPDRPRGGPRVPSRHQH